MFKVKIQMGYDNFTFEFEDITTAKNFANTAFNSIVREKDGNGNLRDVTVRISSYITTRKEEEEEEED